MLILFHDTTKDYLTIWLSTILKSTLMSANKTEMIIVKFLVLVLFVQITSRLRMIYAIAGLNI